MAAVDVSALFARLSGLRRAVEVAEAAALDLFAEAASRRQQIRCVEDALRALGYRVPAGLTGHRKTTPPGGRGRGPRLRRCVRSAGGAR
jgi:hypothetical protein